MTSAQDKAVECLDLSDEEFFELDDAKRRSLALHLSASLRGVKKRSPPGERRKEAPSPVLVLGAPSTIDLDEYLDVPLFVGQRVTRLREWEVGSSRNLRILRADLDSPGAATRLWEHTHKRMALPMPSGAGPQPDGINAGLTLIEVLWRPSGLRELLRIDWRPGRIALTAIYHDWVSNTCVVELKAPEREEGSEETEELGPPPRRASPFLEAGAHEGAPDPGELGVALSLPEAAAYDDPIPAFGALSVPSSEIFVAPASDLDHPEGAVVVAATLLLVALDAEIPVQLDLALPATLVGEEGPEQRVEASFAFELRGASPERLEERYQVYLAAGARVAGPYALKAGF